MSEDVAQLGKMNGHGPSPVLGLKRMAPQRTGVGLTLPSGISPGDAANRMQSRKLVEDKTRARTLARSQAVAEKLSTATEEVAAAINEATSTAEELGKTMQAIAAGAKSPPPPPRSPARPSTTSRRPARPASTWPSLR